MVIKTAAFFHGVRMKYLVSGVIEEWGERKLIAHQFPTEVEREEFIERMGLIEVRRSEVI